MNKRIREKRFQKRIREAEKKAINKLKERYDVYQVKSGYRKHDLIIKGLEDWKVQVQCFSDEPSIIMHPYSILSTFDEAKAYVSMLDVNDNMFFVIDDIIANKEYHLGCCWGGRSKSYEEGLEKYKDYIEAYNKHQNEVKEIKSYVDKYLNDLSKHPNIKEIVVTYLKGDFYKERFNVFILTENVLSNEYDKLVDEISKDFKMENIKSRDKIKSHVLLPGRGIEYKFVGLFANKNKFAKRIGKDVCKIYKK